MTFINIWYSFIFISLALSVTKTLGFSSHWTQVLPKLCADSTPNAIYNSLMNCDQLMDKEVRYIFDDCVKQITGRSVSPAQNPRICYYYTSRKGQQLDNCKARAYRERQLTIKQIISKEYKHMWCVMKIGRPLGWEHLCTAGLSQQKRLAVQRCDDQFSQITQPIAECYYQVFGGGHDGRPLACRSFEHFSELRQCLERKANQSKHNPNKWKDTEQKSFKYMDCLRNLTPR